MEVYLAYGVGIVLALGCILILELVESKREEQAR